MDQLPAAPADLAMLSIQRFGDFGETLADYLKEGDSLSYPDAVALCQDWEDVMTVFRDAYAGLKAMPGDVPLLYGANGRPLPMARPREDVVAVMQRADKLRVAQGLLFVNALARSFLAGVADEDNPIMVELRERVENLGEDLAAARKAADEAEARVAELEARLRAQEEAGAEPSAAIEPAA